MTASAQPIHAGDALIRSVGFTRIVRRYHFDDFVLSPRRRLLLRGETEQPLIPRYFDLLVFLVEHRHEAVHRRDIFDRVWSDSVVSDSALSQAIRTIRRVLGDDPKEPRFIRTVSRHGYRFVFPEVIEEDEDDVTASRAAVDDARADVAEPGPTVAIAALPRESGATTKVARESAATAPLPGESVATRWAAATAGSTIAGVAAGSVGGLILASAPGSNAPFALVPVLLVIGGCCGAIGSAGVCAGLALAQKLDQVPRTLAMTAGAAVGGGVVGTAVQWLARWALASLFGLDIHTGGALEGVMVGGAAGLGLAIATTSTDGALNTTATRKRTHVALITAICCGLVGLALSLMGRPLASGTIHAIANAAEGSRATLAPLGRLIGEPSLGPISSAILTVSEAAAFGFGLAFGLTGRREDGQN